MSEIIDLNIGEAIESKLDRSNWITWKFSDLFENIVEKVVPKDSGLEHYIGLEHLDSGSLHIKRFGETASLIGDKLKIYKGDIIFAKRNAYLKRASIAPFDAVASAHSLVLRPNPKNVLPEFIPFFLMSEKFWQRAIEISVGSLSPTINWKVLAKQEFLLPPKAEQARFAKLLWAMDEVIEREKEVLEITKRFKEVRMINLLNGYNLVNERDELPENWEELKISDIGVVSTSSVDKKDKPNQKEINLLNYMDVYSSIDKRIDSRINFMRVTANDNQLVKNQIKVGDVLFTPSSETADDIGHSAVVTESLPETLYSYHLVRLSFKRNIDINFKRFLFNNPKILYDFSRKAKGVTRMTLSLEDFNNTEFRLPPMEEQKKIATELSLIVDNMIACEGKIASSQTLLNSLIIQVF